jgi:hypothetical protein
VTFRKRWSIGTKVESIIVSHISWNIAADAAEDCPGIRGRRRLNKRRLYEIVGWHG